MRVFKECGYEVIPVASQCVHDPAFGATLSPNPEKPEAYIEAIKLAKKEGAKLIVITDPDGDRLGIAVKDNGQYKFKIDVPVDLPWDKAYKYTVSASVKNTK